MATLVEAVATLVLSALLAAASLSALAATCRLARVADDVSTALFAARQLEHLLDRAVAAAGSGPALPQPVTSVATDVVEFGADLDGNGSVESTGSETSALELRADAAGTRVRIRLGRQVMTVLEHPGVGAVLAALDPAGRPAAPAAASLVDLRLGPTADGSAAPLPLVAHVPAARWR